jgi:transposase-like protein
MVDLKCPYCKSGNWWELWCELHPHAQPHHMSKNCNIRTDHHHYHCGDCLKEWINNQRLWQIAMDRQMDKIEREIQKQNAKRVKN